VRDERHDADLGLKPLGAELTAPSAIAQEQYRRAMQDADCTFAGVEMLPHNIGYLKINVFPDPAVCETAAAAVMARLNGEDAVIIDLRENDGGSPGMASLLTGYLFAKPTHLYSPRGNGPENWTQPVAGSQLVDKPVYVLTSRVTTSAAEQFSYNLKMLKRAMLVGETTRGSAPAGVLDRSARSIGVAPDVKAPAWDALPVAEKLAETRR
jgi:C-terminal processing protease CtpA/Prc